MATLGSPKILITQNTLSLSKLISMDNQYMKIKYISLVLSTDNISCMDGVACTSFRRWNICLDVLKSARTSSLGSSETNIIP